MMKAQHQKDLSALESISTMSLSIQERSHEKRQATSTARKRNKQSHEARKKKSTIYWKGITREIINPTIPTIFIIAPAIVQALGKMNR